MEHSIITSGPDYTVHNLVYGPNSPTRTHFLFASEYKLQIARMGYHTHLIHRNSKIHPDGWIIGVATNTNAIGSLCFDTDSVTLYIRPHITITFNYENPTFFDNVERILKSCLSSPCRCISCKTLADTMTHEQ